MPNRTITWAEAEADRFIKFATIHPSDPITIEDHGTMVTMTTGQALFNAVMFGPLIRRHLPVPDELLYKGGLFTNSAIEKAQTGIFEQFVYEGVDNGVLDDLKEEFIADGTKLSNIIATEMGEYYRPLDMPVIVKTLRNPALREVLDSFDMNEALSRGVKYVQDAHKEYGDRVVKAFSTVEENNCFRPYLALGALNAGQFVRLVGSIGLVTDVDDTVIPVPITSNYLNGYDSINYYAMDSLTAKKSDHYSKDNMKDAQYNNRKMQLLVSSVGLIKSGDCGSNLTLQIEIPADVPNPEKFAQRYVGKIVHTQEGPVQISKRNIKRFIGKRLKMRSTSVCKHKSAFCHACGGQMARILPQTSNAGIAAVLEFISDLVQSILSAKHLAVTNIMVYQLSRLLTEVFELRDSALYFRQGRNFDPKQLLIGVNVADAAHIEDLSYVTTSSLNEQFFTRITNISVARADTGELLAASVPMGDEYGNSPYFTEEYLTSIRNRPEATSRNGDILWFKMDNIDPSQPVIKIPAVSESALVFINKIMSFFEKDIRKYTDLSIALRDLSRLVWERSDVNVIHLETALKACLITSERDFTLPLVTDPTHVTFGGLREIITNRHFGTEMAFERITQAIVDPGFYLQEKQESLFDQFLGTRDHIYPEDYGLSPVADRRYVNRKPPLTA